MKRTLKKLTAVFIAAAMALTCLPQAVIAAILPPKASTMEVKLSYQDFTYTIDYDGTISILGYTGRSTKITIPSEIYGKKVTTINSLAGGASLVEVTIPETVNKINAFKFCGSSSLTAIHVDENNKYYKDIDGVMFTKDEKTIVMFPNGKSTSYTIPDSVTTIGEWAFSGSELVDLTIPESVTTIEYNAFCGCKFKKLNLPDGLTTIEDQAFYECTALKSIMIPASVTEFEKCVGIFYYCSNITASVYPGSVAETYVKTYANIFKCILLKDCIDEKTGIKVTTGVPDDAQLTVEQTENTDTRVSYDMAFTQDGEEIAPDGTISLRIPIPESFNGKEMYVYYKNEDGNLTNLSYFVSKGCLVIAADCLGEYLVSTEKCINYADFYTESNGGSEMGTLTITKYIGSDAEVVVPSEIDGKKVTRIGDRVFSNCLNLTKVTFSDGIEYIGSSAFEHCNSLTEVYFPKSVKSISAAFAFLSCANLTDIHVDENNENYKDIDGVLFTKDGKTLITFPAGKAGAYVIPDGVTKIDGDTFKENSFLTEITIPDSVTEINENNFFNCKQLTAIHVDENNPNYTDIDGVMFIKDKKTVLKVPAGKAGAYVIPDGVTTIGDSAFYTCESLTEITIPKSVTTIYECPFAYCDTLTAIHVDENNPNYKDIDGVLFSKDGKTIIEAPAGISGTYVVPDGVTTIESSAFESCGSNCVIVPESVTEIGAYAFSSSRNFTLMCYAGSYAATYAKENGISYTFLYPFSDKETGIEIEASVSVDAFNVEQTETTDTSVSYDITFTKNEKKVKPTGGVLVSVPVPESWSADTVFVYSKSSDSTYTNIITVKEVAVSDGRIVFVAGALEQFILCSEVSDKSVLDYTYKELQDGTLSIQKYSGSDTETITPSEVIGKKVTEIGDAFNGNKTLTKITISDGVTKIWQGYAFANCTSLEKVILPDSLIDLSGSTFENCTSLTEINIPDGVTTIGKSTFLNCTSLTEIKIPDSVTTIGESAFYNCISLTEIDLPDSLTTIDYEAFTNCLSITTVDLPAGLTTIGGSAFADCSALTEIELPDGLTTIVSGAFARTSLTEIKIPDSVTEIGQFVFMSSSLKNITLSANITSIGYETFMNCSYLTEIEIPDSVRIIDVCAFMNCSSLKKIVIPSSVTTMSADAFSTDSGSVIDVTIYGYTNSYAETYANEFEIPFVSLGLFLDSESDVSVTADKDVLPDDTKLDVEQTDTTDTSVSYNITLTQNGKEIQPEGSVTVRIPVPEGWDVNEIYVYHKDANGVMTDINAVVSDDYITFTTDHFSEYVISSTKIASTIKGDTNGDGLVTELDSVSLARYLANWDVTIDEKAADLDSDGSVTEIDSVILARRLAGWNV